MLNYTDLFEPLLLQFESLTEEEKESIMIVKDKEKQVEEVKMLSEVKEPFVDLEKCSLHELISILQKFASDPSVNIN